MKNQPLSNARYLGMTITQVIVLACFGLVTMGVVGFGAWTVLRSSFPGGLFPTREILPVLDSLANPHALSHPDACRSLTDPDRGGLPVTYS